MIPIPLASAATLHVPADYPTIQSCITAAVSGQDECVVAPGTYNELINFLGKAITVRSSQGAGVTTISGTGLNGTVVKCISSETSETCLDGFTITGGKGTQLSAGGQLLGGGMLNNHSSPTVRNCTFSGNTIGGKTGVGGGLCILEGNSRITNCLFTANSAPSGGGGVFIESGGVLITNCTFSGNSVPVRINRSGWGGAIYTLFSSSSVIGCRFIANTAPVGGGIYNENGSPIVKDSSFIGNSVSSGGGGMGTRGGNLQVSNCAFSKNSAYNGGGMYISDANSVVVSCTFVGNTSTSYGGGMYYHNLFDTVILSNCTFSGNIAVAGAGGGIYTDNALEGRPLVGNSILWGDTMPELVNVDSSPIFRFSNVQGGIPVEAIDDDGNLALPPHFTESPNPGPDGMWDGVNDDLGDLRLQPGSPCINAGDPDFVPQPGETDLDGHARVLCGRVDMGAYEFGIGDVDCNHTVDLMDLAAWEQCMTDPLQSTIANRQSAIQCEALDFDSDSDIDLSDFASLQRILVSP